MGGGGSPAMTWHRSAWTATIGPARAPPKTRAHPSDIFVVSVARLGDGEPVAPVATGVAVRHAQAVQPPRLSCIESLANWRCLLSRS